MVGRPKKSVEAINQKQREEIIEYWNNGYAAGRISIFMVNKYGRELFNYSVIQKILHMHGLKRNKAEAKEVMPPCKLAKRTA